MKYLPGFWGVVFCFLIWTITAKALVLVHWIVQLQFAYSICSLSKKLNENCVCKYCNVVFRTCTNKLGTCVGREYDWYFGWKEKISEIVDKFFTD
jgi:hypothetical protein